MKRNFRPGYSHVFQIMLAILGGALVFGCAPQNAGAPIQGQDRMSAMLSAGSSSLSGSSSNGVWNCPESPNVTLANNISPNGGYSYAGDGFFTVCTPSSVKSGATTFQISGATSAAGLCFYPMTYGSNGVPTLVGTPQCMNVTGGALTVSFSALSAPINYMVIVDSNMTSALNACLSSAAACPAHSEGFVE